MTDIERLIDQFLAYIDVERGLAKATVRAYDSDLRKYNGWLATQGIQDLNAVTTQDVERYIAFLDDSGESARSKARRLASIHAFHRFALNEHVVSNDVAAQVKAPKGATTLPDVLTVDEVASLLDAIPVSQNRPQSEGMADMPDDPAMLRDKALLEFMYATGARVSEACGANLDDVDLESNVARLMGKGSKQRLVPVGSYACERSQDTSKRTASARVEGERAHRTTRVVPQQARQTTVKAIGVGDHPCGRGTRAYRQAPASAHIAPFLRHASDPRRGRRAHRAGTAGSRERHHHADLHACKPGEPHRDISDLASKGKIA